MIQTIINKRQKMLACFTYIGVVGLLTCLICRNNDDEFLLGHSQNSTCIFLATILAYPLCKLISKYYFYYLSSYLGLILSLSYVVLIYLKINGIKKACLGQSVEKLKMLI